MDSERRRRVREVFAEARARVPEKDPDLASLHGDSKFQKLVAAARENQKR